MKLRPWVAEPFARRNLIRPAIFGIGDGLVALLGAILFLSGHPHLVFPAAVTSGATAAVSMAGFSWLSGGRDAKLGESCLLGAATWLGSLLPMLPYGFGARGPVALGAAAGVYTITGVTIALVWPAWSRALSLGKTVAVFAAVFIAVLWLRGLVMHGLLHFFGLGSAWHRLPRAANPQSRSAVR